VSSALPQDRPQVERLLEHVSDGVLLLDTGWRVRYINAAGARLLGRERSSLSGRVLWEEFPESVGSEFWEAYHRAMRRQEAETLEAYYGPLGGWFEARALPSPEGLTIYFSDVNPRRLADRQRADLVASLTAALRRSEQLLALTHALSQALDIDAVGAIVAEHVSAALQSLFAGVAVLDEERAVLRYISMAPLPEEVAEEWTEFALSLPVPASDTVRLREPLVFADRAEIVSRYPHIAADLETAGTEGMANVPITASGRAIGALMVTWSWPHPCDEQELRFLETVAGQAAQAVERARLFARQTSVAATLQRAILRRRSPRSPAARSLLATSRPRRASRSAATGTTPSRCPTVGSCCQSATWAVTGSRPPRPWASCATPSVRTPWTAATPRRSSASSTGCWCMAARVRSPRSWSRSSTRLRDRCSGRARGTRRR
jgi:hypothetical protein